jgi:1,6-anhydro-N-acetylmuramate kinase
MYRFLLPEDPTDLAYLMGRLSFHLRGWAEVLDVTRDELDALDADAKAFAWATLAADQARAEAEARARYLTYLS